MIRCPNCGATISRRDRVCPYCGAPNPAFQPPADEVNALLEQGMRAFQQESYALAADAFQQVIDQKPDIFDAYFYLAASLSALNRNPEAIDALKKAQKLRPDSAPLYYNLGLLYKQAGQAREAKAALEEAMKRADLDVALQNRTDFKQRIARELKALRA